MVFVNPVTYAVLGIMAVNVNNTYVLLLCIYLNTKFLQGINPAKMTKDMQNIIGCLFNNGADPTVKCKAGRTPRDIATQNNFTLGAALFGNLHLMILS